MQLKLGQLIIDTTGGCRDTGVITQVYEDCYGDNIYSIYWVCPRELGGYTTTLAYTEEELEIELSRYFEVIP